MRSTIISKLCLLPQADSQWVMKYVDFLETHTLQEDQPHTKHHILPRGLFPEYKSLKTNPWNCVRLTLGDHIRAHYYLHRALPTDAKMAFALRIMVNTRGLYWDKTLVDESAVEAVAEYYDFTKSVHFRKTLVFSAETRAKLAKAASEAVWSDERRKCYGDAMRGKTWKWSSDAKDRNYFHTKEGHGNLVRSWWKGKTQSESSNKKRSDSLKQFHAAHPDHIKRKTGPEHHYYGKHRDPETCAKISKTLTGMKQSEESKRLKSIALIKARWPEFPPQDLATFEYIWSKRITDPAERRHLLKSVAPVSYQMVKGLYLLIDNAIEVDKRYWRQAKFWVENIYTKG